MHRLFLAAATAAVLLLAALPSDAAYIGNAPWCAVTDIGSGNMEWDCEYPSAAACQPNVIAGNRGFCGLNPYYLPAPPPYGAAHIKRSRRYSHQY
jgi:hypothetical protein